MHIRTLGHSIGELTMSTIEARGRRRTPMHELMLLAQSCTKLATWLASWGIRAYWRATIYGLY